MNKLTIELWSTKQGIYIYKNDKLVKVLSTASNINLKDLIKLLKSKK